MMEEVKIIKQNETDSEILKQECYCMEANETVCEADIEEMKIGHSTNIDPVQLTEESDIKHNINLSTHTTYESALNRIKDKPFAKYGDDVSLYTDAVTKKNKNVQPTLYVKVEKLEEKLYMDIEKFENIDISQLNEEFDIKSESDPGTVSEAALDWIKDEYTAEHKDDVNLFTDAIKQTKTEGKATVEVKDEKREEKLYLGGTKLENMDTLELNEELDIKSESDPDIVSDSASSSAAKKTKSVKEPEVAQIVEGERKLFTCYNCNYTFCYKNALKSHMNGINCKLTADLNKLPFVCIRKGSLIEYVCSKCDIVFKHKSSLANHLVLRHVESIPKLSSDIHKCTMCDYRTIHKCNFRQHILTHTGGFKLSKCNHCNASFRSKQSLDDHIIKKHPKFTASVSYIIHKCPHCSYKTTHKSSFHSHTSTHNPLKLKNCNHCDASFKRDVSLDDHILRKHPSFSASVSRKIYECIQCSYRTAYRQCSIKHMRTHAGKLMCRICDYKTVSKCDLRKHISTYTCGFNCNHCDVSFKNKRSLDDHILQKHPSFTATVSSKIHECTQCSYRTAFKQGFIKHMMAHAGKLMCRICDYKTVSKCDLRKHNLTHSGAWKCNHCDASFKHKQSLDDHILKKHPSFTTSVSSKIHERIHCSYRTTSTQKFSFHMMKHTRKFEKFLCANCDASFKSKTSLADHISGEHSSLNASVPCRIYECCTTTFKSKTTFDDHIMKKHSDIIA